jgi:TDG/mug DNA glycosylase family protein
VPLALADLHRSLPGGARVRVVLPPALPAGRRRDIVRGAGFTGSPDRTVTRARELPDMVGPGMRLLLVGLNPSIYAADAGIGFARPGNRFWPAALAAGIVSRDRDPRHALLEHGVGMTDLVKRATVAAAALRAGEYRAGVARVERLVTWLRPGAVCVLGLGGWRAAVDRHAVAGPQPAPFGGRPAYLMPNPSGLNARATVDNLAEHLAAAAALADGRG